MKDKYDVIVVGAGPAGSSVATTASKAGLDVLLIEKRQEIGDPVRCAEGVDKEGIKRHIKPDPRWIAAEVKGSRIFAPDGTKLQISEKMSGAEVGYVLERKIFDRALAEQAVSSGAEVIVKTSATGLIRKNKQITGIHARSIGESVDIKAKIVVGADGVESKVGRFAGINTTLAPKDIETCAQFLVSGIEADEYCQFYLGNNIAPGGYAWVFPKGKGIANVGIGVLGSLSNNGMPVKLLSNFVKHHFPTGKIIEMVLGAVPASGPIEKTIADGFMLVGDSARQSDPLTGGGILNALDAGVMAGTVAASCIEKDDVSEKALMEYERQWRETIGKKISKTLVVKEKLITFTDKQFNIFAHSIEGKCDNTMGVFDIVRALFRANPKLLWEFRNLIK
ncbi:MAG: digeranylgeranylglycerophospholipid reductase [Candidatus Argoarchaeum ethanivorans]|uniref:Digeranylgeranylglycerophospholipid reductase n=1 Tax=Candidatus Argoarchaeum ethanivorans TaxID=2608793 RepID=A0A8B3RYW7_9EURY|nr:MAG: digeranylgeranylglycerophospholipid reductase [Candidatus Argoarchaeum ethanivorans]